MNTSLYLSFQRLSFGHLLKTWAEPSHCSLSENLFLSGAVEENIQSMDVNILNLTRIAAPAKLHVAITTMYEVCGNTYFSLLVHKLQYNECITSNSLV